MAPPSRADSAGSRLRRTQGTPALTTNRSTSSSRSGCRGATSRHRASSRCRGRPKGLDHRFVFAAVDAPGDHQAATRRQTEARADRGDIGILLQRREVVLQVPGDRHPLCRSAQRQDPIRIGGALHAEQTNILQDAPEPPPDQPVSRERPGRDPSVDQHHRDPPRGAGGEKIRPELRLGQEHQARPKPRQGSRRGPSEIQRKEHEPGGRDPLLGHRSTGFRRGGGDQGNVGMPADQESRQGCGRHGLSHGHRVQPHRSRGAFPGRYAAEPLRDVPSVLPPQEHLRQDARRQSEQEEADRRAIQPGHMPQPSFANGIMRSRPCQKAKITRSPLAQHPSGCSRPTSRRRIVATPARIRRQDTHGPRRRLIAQSRGDRQRAVMGSGQRQAAAAGASTPPGRHARPRPDLRVAAGRRPRPRASPLAAARNA